MSKVKAGKYAGQSAGQDQGPDQRGTWPGIDMTVAPLQCGSDWY